VFSDESAGSFRQLCCFLYIKLFRTMLTLSGFGNTTIVVAAIDAANAFRVCHIGNLSTNLLINVFEQLLFFELILRKLPIWRMRTGLAASMAAIKKDMYVNPLSLNNVWKLSMKNII